jgi:anthranilate synthase component II
MKKVLLIDNFDSFTFNLKALTEASGNVTVDVVRNNRVTNELVENYNYLMLSPGPGLPAQAGRMPEILNYIIGKKPVLGICLGHQAIVEALGGKLLNLTRPLHGIATEIHLSDSPVFEGINKTIQGGRYHSWVADHTRLPGNLRVIAHDSDGFIMGVEDLSRLTFGLQFHPESILSNSGSEIIKNFLNL